jgi:hypothetical protein
VPVSPQLLAVTNSGNNSITVSWTDEGFTHTGYKLYVSSNGINFNAPISLSSSALKYVDSGLYPGATRYYKVTVANSTNESGFSCIYGAKVNPAPPILVVDGNDRFRFVTNNPQSTNHSFAAMTGQSISAPAFDTAYHGAIGDGTVKLTNYAAAVWLCGSQSTQDRTFDSTVQPLVTTFLNQGGNLFVSGAEIGWDLDRASGPTTADRNFYHNQLRAVLNNDDANTHSFTPLASGIFTGDTAGNFDNGVGGYTYDVAFPDVLVATNGSIAAINYVGGLGGVAAVVYDGTPNSGKVVNWGFPFETITNSALRDIYMADVLRFFNLLPTPTLFQATVTDTNITLTWSSTPGIKYRVEYTTDLNPNSWTALAPDITATTTTSSKVDSISATQRFYRVLLLN